MVVSLADYPALRATYENLEERQHLAKGRLATHISPRNDQKLSDTAKRHVARQRIWVHRQQHWVDPPLDLDPISTQDRLHYSS